VTCQRCGWTCSCGVALLRGNLRDGYYEYFCSRRCQEERKEEIYTSGLAIGPEPLPPWLADKSAHYWKMVARPDRRDAMAQVMRELNQDERVFHMLTEPAPWGFETIVRDHRDGTQPPPGRVWVVDNERGVLRRPKEETR